MLCSSLFQSWTHSFFLYRPAPQSVHSRARCIISNPNPQALVSVTCSESPFTCWYCISSSTSKCTHAQNQTHHLFTFWYSQLFLVLAIVRQVCPLWEWPFEKNNKTVTEWENLILQKWDDWTWAETVHLTHRTQTDILMWSRQRRGNITALTCLPIVSLSITCSAHAACRRWRLDETRWPRRCTTVQRAGGSCVLPALCFGVCKS